ncbi:MAG: hypothetical protein WCP29_13145 [Acidobacteriota bacterium]
MMAPWRPLALAAALNMTVVVGITTAQTVMVTKAPRGGTIELALNANAIGTATADATGKATLPVNLSARGTRTEADVQVFVDVCGNTRRVVLVEPGLQAQPPTVDCSRRELPGVFLMRSVTTLVVEVAASAPAVWVRQGPVPIEWLGEESSSISSKQLHRPSPTGLILSGGGGMGSLGNVTTNECGGVATCSGKTSQLGYVGGATIWLTSFLGVEGSYAKSANATVTGSDAYLHFANTTSTNLVTAAAKVGIPLGAVRFYAKAGADRHQSTSTTTQTIDDRSYVTADGATQSVTGGTQKFVLRTAGWALSFGGGMEVWLGSRVGLYVEGEQAKLKGPSRDGDPGKMNDQMTSIRIGLLLRLIGR